ncbi:GNAT family N-acetyltransferase [Vibrio sp. nBUS_14]|uniref:GNAT family N-acetyltransferase n=1 Tax=Vibrio sp. nBUS_14 TaxID=3395321 RepID=UPI003EB8E8F6
MRKIHHSLGANMDVDCKVVTSKDSLKYRAVRLESLKLHPECFGSGHEAQSQLPTLYFEGLIESDTQESVMIGAYAGEDLVGLCGLTPVEGSALEIIQMYVSARFRGQAIGSKMLAKANTILEPRSEKELRLTVFASNIAAIKVYQDFGFETKTTDGNELVMIFQPST